MSYAKVHEEYWDGEKIQPLSDAAALLGLFLLAGPHRNAIGCFKLGKGAISDIKRFEKWGTEGVSKALLEMENTGFIVRDDETGWTLIVNYLKKDPINNIKIAIHACALAHRVPKNTVVYQHLVEILGPQLQPFADKLSGKEGWPIEAPYNDQPKGHTKPHRTPEPLPEPEPEPSAPDGAGAAAPKPVPVVAAHETADDPLRLPLARRVLEAHGDWKKMLFDHGLKFMVARCGGTEATHRPLLGKWLASTHDDAKTVYDLLAVAERDNVADVKSWMTAHLGGKKPDTSVRDAFAAQRLA